VVLLSTCNRVEIYGVTSWIKGKAHRLFQLLANGSGNDLDFSPHLYVKEGAEAVEHLFSVASGLDSMVLGETEITGQVKQAYQTAQEARLTGKILNRLFQTALQSAKEIRTRTHIGRGATSVGSVAVELAEKIFATSLARHSVMIVGAGKMGEACLRHLTKKGARSILVSNRSYERACELAGEFGGQAVRFDDCAKAMVGADIVISSPGAPRAILGRPEIEAVMETRRGRPLFLIDIAVPRDIDPEVQFINNVYLYNIDHLEGIVRENVRLREQELTQCQAIIHEKTAALWARVGPALKESPERVRTRPDWTLLGAAPCRA
jgi:glutamyl-tRNA reductase